MEPKELLEDLWDELHRGKVYEASLRSKKWVMDGLQSGQDIFIDPRPSILETLLHELLHRRKPRLKERSVERLSKTMVALMDEPTKKKWWRAYSKIKRRSGAVDVVD